MLFENLSSDLLLHHAINNCEGVLLENKRLAVKTGKWTGRCPHAKKYVKCSKTIDTIDWKKNKPLTKKEFSKLKKKFISSENIKYKQKLYASKSKKFQIGINVYTENAWHSLFSKNMFIENSSLDIKETWNLYHIPSLLDYPLVAISFEEKCILISGTDYAGEIKKSIFSVINFNVAEEQDLPMHCSANCNEEGETTLYFGLSGTGKTTLSLTDDRILIGDDEHIWDDEGITNIEGGCYAKVINLSKVKEKSIWHAVHKPYSILENVVISKEIDFSDSRYSQNSRCSFDINNLNVSKTNQGGHPKNIVFLTFDAFGVLPAVSLLDETQAKNLFCLGYTSKVAGTEMGVEEPQATYSHCFGAPFLPHKVCVYEKIFLNKIKKHGTNVWLVNTGYFNGDFKSGNRISIDASREIIKKINSNAFKSFFKHGFTNLLVPEDDGISENYLKPETGWKNLNSYISQLKKISNFLSAVKVNI